MAGGNWTRTCRQMALLRHRSQALASTFGGLANIQLTLVATHCGACFCVRVASNLFCRPTAPAFQFLSSPHAHIGPKSIIVARERNFSINYGFRANIARSLNLNINW